MKIFMLTLLLSISARAFDSAPLSKTLEKSGIGLSSFSVLVQSGGAEKPLFELNADEPRIPASLTKLVTGAAALDAFPAGHQFVTEILVDGPVKEGVLKGNLYLVGDGDPGFVSETLWVLVNNFVRSGITKIEGDLIVDDSKFDRVRFDPSRNKNRVDRAYDAPVGAMSFNWNSVNIYVRPGKLGEAAQVVVDPENDYFQLVNQTKTVKGRKQSIQFDMDIVGNKESSHHERLVVRGTFGAKHKEKVFFRAVEDPALWSLQNLKSFLARRGVSHQGALRMSRPPMSARQVAKVKSRPIAQLVRSMMKFSNNFVAESLIKNLAAQKGARPASLESGVGHLRTFLGDLQIGDFQLANPSGLSRDNKFSARQIVKVLEFAEASGKIQPEFTASLPVAGVDGTLKSRMKSLARRGDLRAKTGMLSGAIGLAGYVGNGKDKMSFCFLFNGSAKDQWKARDVMDQLATQLAQ